MDDNTPKSVVYVDLGDKNFLLPYIERELSDYNVVTEACASGVDYAVLLSDTDIYDVPEGEGIDEDAPLNESSEYAVTESRFCEICLHNKVKPTILRLANVVATGMGGFPMRLVCSIGRASFMHIEGNDARISTVHGVDVATAVRQTLGSGEVYNVTDGEDPKLYDFAEAIAYRLNQKRIFRVKKKWAVWLMPKSRRMLYQTTKTFSSEKLRRSVDFRPHSVTKYLKTHVYDDESL